MLACHFLTKCHEVKSLYQSSGCCTDRTSSLINPVQPSTQYFPTFDLGLNHENSWHNHLARLDVSPFYTGDEPFDLMVVLGDFASSKLNLLIADVFGGDMDPTDYEKSDIFHKALLDQTYGNSDIFALPRNYKMNMLTLPMIMSGDEIASHIVQALEQTKQKVHVKDIYAMASYPNSKWLFTNRDTWPDYKSEFVSPGTYNAHMANISAERYSEPGTQNFLSQNIVAATKDGFNFFVESPLYFKTKFLDVFKGVFIPDASGYDIGYTQFKKFNFKIFWLDSPYFALPHYGTEGIKFRNLVKNYASLGGCTFNEEDQDRMIGHVPAKRNTYNCTSSGASIEVWSHQAGYALGSQGCQDYCNLDIKFLGTMWETLSGAVQQTSQYTPMPPPPPSSPPPPPSPATPPTPPQESLDMPPLKISYVNGPDAGTSDEDTAAKIVVLYADEDIDDLSMYAIGVANNGFSQFGGAEDLLSGKVKAGQYITILRSNRVYNYGPAPGLDNIQQTGRAGPIIETSKTSQNGDDTVQLFVNETATEVGRNKYDGWKLIDSFGDLTRPGEGEFWNYKDGYVKRKLGTYPSANGEFSIDDWHIVRSMYTPSQVKWPYGNVYGFASSHKIGISYVNGPDAGTSAEDTAAKIVVLYAYEDIEDLSLYALGVASNGISRSGGAEVLLSGSVKSGQFITFLRSNTVYNYGSPPGSEQKNNSGLLGPIFTTSKTSQNGDDTVQLFLNESATEVGTNKYDGWKLIDSFGDLTRPDEGETWNYKDGYAKRKPGTYPKATFDIKDWIITTSMYIPSQTQWPFENVYQFSA